MATASTYRHAVRNQHAVGAVVRGPPGDHKWFSHLAAAAVVVRKLRAINTDCPAADSAAAGQMAEVRAELMAELTGRPAA